MVEFKGEFEKIEATDEGYMVLFRSDSFPIGLSDVKGTALRVTAKKWFKHKSASQNAFLWEYISQLATAMDTSKDEMYEILLQRYPQYDDLPPILISRDRGTDEILKKMSETDDIEHRAHWQYIGNHPKDDSVAIFRKILGVSQMDSKQIAWFTDRVLDECRENDIKVRDMYL